MGKKRGRDHTEDHIQKKIRKLESKLKRKRRRLRVISSSSENELSDSEIMDKHEDIVPCSSNNPLSDNLATQPANAEPELDEETLLLLGEAPNIETALGPNIHKDIATRWQDILKKGLTKEVKDAMLKEYIVPANCEFLVPPVLNAEVKAAMPNSLVKRVLGIVPNFVSLERGR